MAAQMLKQLGKWMWPPERVICVVGSGGMAGGATARVASTCGLKLLFLQSVPFRMKVDLILSADTVTGLPRTSEH
jgi:hypothetical protein